MRIKYYYVYIVKCADGSYYTGFTNDPYRRLEEHNSGVYGRSFTFKRRPVVLVYVKAFSDPLEGIEFEKQVKRWSKAKKEALIAGDIDLLKLLSRSWNENHPSSSSG